MPICELHNFMRIPNVFPKVMVSGYFDPIQPGHLEYFKFAKSGNYMKYIGIPYVIAVIHTPEDIVKKSGFYIYEVEELTKILLGYRNYIDMVMVAIDTDGKVAETVRKIKPDYFIKGPDRNPDNMVKEELKACKEVGCKVIYQPGSKINSSSNIKNRIREQFLNNRLEKL